MNYRISIKSLTPRHFGILRHSNALLSDQIWIEIRQIIRQYISMAMTFGSRQLDIDPSERCHIDVDTKVLAIVVKTYFSNCIISLCSSTCGPRGLLNIKM